MTWQNFGELLVLLLGAVIMGNYLYWFLDERGLFRKKKPVSRKP